MHRGAHSRSMAPSRFSLLSAGAYFTASFSMAARFSPSSSKIRTVPKAMTLRK